MSTFSLSCSFQDRIELWLDDDLPCPDIEKSNENEPVPVLFARLIETYLRFLLLWQAMFRISDVGLGVLLSFFAALMLIMARVLAIESLKTFSKYLPVTVRAARKFLGRNKDSFTKYACCPKCSSLYPLEKCIIKLPNNATTSLKCTFIRHPNHPHKRFRQPCGTVLMKSVQTPSGTTYLYPRQMYCYNSLIDFLRHQLVERDLNFVNRCEAWRERVVEADVLNDVFDGQIWKDFQNYEGNPFLSVPYNFAVSLNCDWFQPFKSSVYSMGIIYLAFLNLPRDERFKSENILLLGVIPGPHEPELTINTFLRPLVDELLVLWDGIVMKTHDSRSVLVRAALLCVACDIPAARKVCGFPGHRAYHGCSKCLKTFPTDKFGETPDYSGFDRINWPARTLEAHREHVNDYKKANTLAAQKIIEREKGCRYSVLMDLPYFDPIRMCIIDPMHNLLLGTAKQMAHIWTELGFLTESQDEEIQKKVDSFYTPDDIGRIPSKISSGFSRLTADQWRNWTLIFSLYCLKDILPYTHYNCWQFLSKHVICYVSTLFQYNN